MLCILSNRIQNKWRVTSKSCWASFWPVLLQRGLGRQNEIEKRSRDWTREPGAMEQVVLISGKEEYFETRLKLRGPLALGSRKSHSRWIRSFDGDSKHVDRQINEWVEDKWAGKGFFYLHLCKYAENETYQPFLHTVLLQVLLRHCKHAFLGFLCSMKYKKTHFAEVVMYAVKCVCI